jgi:hypothetical protein
MWADDVLIWHTITIPARTGKMGTTFTKLKKASLHKVYCANNSAWKINSIKHRSMILYREPAAEMILPGLHRAPFS